MELRQLNYFVMAAKLTSITRAAEKLHTSQPNITTAIQKLESELGVPLFTRKQKRLHLTPEGAIFLEQIETALQQIQDAVRKVTEAGRRQQGRIRIGIPPTIGAMLFPAILARFTELYPGIEIVVAEEGTWSLGDKIEAGELDLGLIILTGTNEQLHSEQLAKPQIMVCLPPEHRLAAKPALTISDLSQEPLILLGEHSYHHHIIMPEFDKQGIKPHILLTTNQVETIKGLVANRVGISFLFEGLTRQAAGIAAKPLDPPLFVAIGLAWSSRRPLSAASRALVDFAKQTVHDGAKPEEPT